jgi:hypothetical protein
MDSTLHCLSTRGWWTYRYWYLYVVTHLLEDLIGTGYYLLLEKIVIIRYY